MKRRNTNVFARIYARHKVLTQWTKRAAATAARTEEDTARTRTSPKRSQFLQGPKKTFGDSHQQMIVLNPPYSARSLNRTPRPRLKLLRSPSLASTLALAALTLSTAAASRSSAARRRAAAAASREASRESNSRRRAALAWERSDSNWKRGV